MIDKSELIKEYLRKNQDVPDRRVADFLYKRHPGLWDTYNACYCSVRYYRGNRGKDHREYRKEKEQYPRIPRAKRSKKAVRINDKGRWFVTGDWHVPYHDERAIEAGLRWAVDRKSEHLLLNGDALDAYQCSHWVRDPNMRHVDKEIEVLKALLHEVQSYFSGRKIYKIGNHEDRISTYLYSNAPQMIGMTKWNLGEQLRNHLELGDDWEFIDSKRLYKLGKLHGYHGHELPRGLTNPVSVGRGVWLRTKQSGFTNHWHSSSTHIESNGSKTKTWVCFSVGCLCDLHPPYAPVNGWNHGVCQVEVGPRGDFNETNVRIVDGAIWG